MWSGLTTVAAANPYAWSRRERSARDVADVGPDNRMVSFPYPKSLVGNPFVNQGAALLVTDAETARSLGIPEARWVHPLGGAGADEPTDPRARTAYHHVPALDVTVREVQQVTGTTADEYDVVELYSCFPAMPKLTRRALGRDATAPISVTGGLSFFGGPGSNYLTHSIAAMALRLRESGGVGFIHGVGEMMTKHRAMVIGAEPHPRGYVCDAEDVVAIAPAAIVIDDGYEGSGTIETCSISYRRDATPDYGIVIGRGSHGERFGAQVDADDTDTIAALESGAPEAIGA